MGTGDRQAASVAILRDGRVLLVRRAREPYAGLWTLPGGRSEPGEPTSATARREIAEELALDIDPRPLVEMEAAGWRLAVFWAPAPPGPIVSSGEVAAWRWATLAEADELDTTPGLDDVLRRVPGLA